MKKFLFPVFVWAFFSCTGPGREPENGKGRVASWVADTQKINQSVKLLQMNGFENSDTALMIAIRAESLATAISYPEGLARASFEHGVLLYRENMYREALDCFSRAYDLADSSGLTRLKANSTERMASVHFATDDPGLALKLYYDALLLFEKIPDSAGIAKIYNIIGIHKTGTEEYDSAEVYFRKAIDINTKLKQDYNLIENKGNLAYMYERKGDLVRAERLYFSLEAELMEMHDSMSLPVIYFDRASLYQEKNKPDSALLMLEKAILIAGPVNDTVLLSTLYGNQGELHYNAGNMAKASMSLRKSVKCAHATKDVETEAQALEWLMKIDSVAGNYKDAYFKSRMIAVLLDTLFQQKLRHSSKTARLHYENEQRKGIIGMQLQKIDAAKKKTLLYRILFLISLLAGIQIVFLLILERKSLKKKKLLVENQLLIRDLQVEQGRKDKEIAGLMIEKAQADLKIREREMVTIAIGLEQKNEFLNRISKRIREAFPKDPGTGPAARVDEIIASIKHQLNTSGEDGLFNQQFAAVHDKFHASLKAVHPSLTQSEMKFCAYLKMNMSGNQIAGSLNVTSEAIRKTRYRIRKKMGLKPSDSLEEHISQF